MVGKQELKISSAKGKRGILMEIIDYPLLIAYYIHNT